MFVQDPRGAARGRSSSRARCSLSCCSPTRSTAPRHGPRARCSRRCRRARSRSPAPRTRCRDRSACSRPRTRSSCTAPIPLPEAQLDRFLLKLRFGYPSDEDLSAIIVGHRLHGGGGAESSRSPTPTSCCAWARSPARFRRRRTCSSYIARRARAAAGCPTRRRWCATTCGSARARAAPGAEPRRAASPRCSTAATTSRSRTSTRSRCPRCATGWCSTSTPSATRSPRKTSSPQALERVPRRGAVAERRDGRAGAALLDARRQCACSRR